MHTGRQPAGMQTALVVEGGGMRAAFSSGVTDAFLQADFNPFSLLVGVSSGASTIASYLSKQEGRNLAVLLDQSCRPEFIRWSRFIRGGDLMDIDWLWQVVQQENPLDCERMFAQQRDFRIVLSNALSGEPEYAVAQPDSFYTTDQIVCDVASLLIGFVACYHFFDAIYTIVSGVLRSFNKTFIPTLILGSCLWGIGLCGGYFLTFDGEFGVKGFWFALIIAAIIASKITLLYFHNITLPNKYKEG